MLLDAAKICIVLRKVSVIQDHLKNCPHPQEPNFNPDHLHWAVQDAYGLAVEMTEVIFNGSHLCGTVERYNDSRARVLVRSGMSTDMMRFVAVKELCHLMNDEQDDWSTLGVTTIRSLLVEWDLAAANGNGTENPTYSLQSEYLAEIGATEFMYPFMYRDADIKKLDADKTSIAKIALEHEMPAYAVEQALRHHETFGKLWEEVSQEK